MKACDIEPSLSANGVSKEAFDAALPAMIDRVYDDQCTVQNPRQPSMAEIKQLLLSMY